MSFSTIDYIEGLTFIDINSYMYENEVDIEYKPEIVPVMKAMFNDFVKMKQRILYRYTNHQLDIKDNKVFLKSFTSTSKDFEYVKSSVRNDNKIIEFVFDDEFYGIDAEPLSVFKEEREIILPPGEYQVIEQKDNYYKLKLIKQYHNIHEWINCVDLYDKEFFIEKLNNF